MRDDDGAPGAGAQNRTALDRLVESRFVASRFFNASSAALVFLTVLVGCSAPPTHDTTPTGSESPSSSSPTADTPDLPTLPHLAPLAALPAGHISDLAFSPGRPDRAWLASNVNALGVWRSDDAGRTWNRIYYDDNFGGTHTNSIAVHPVEADSVIGVDLHGRITRTTDGGTTWTAVHEEPNPLWSVAFARSDPTQAYVGTGSGDILKSQDAGATWRTTGRVGEAAIAALAVDPTDSQRVLAASIAGLHESVDGGATWSRTFPASGEQEVVELAIDGGDPRHVLLATVEGIEETRDGGATWKGRLDEHAHVIAFSASNPEEAYAGTANGIYRSHDGGAHWTPASDDVAGLDIGALAIHPTDATLALAGTNIWEWTAHGHEFPETTGKEGLYRTTNGGDAWTRIDGGLRDVDVIAITTHPGDAALVVVGTECSRGLFRTRSGGADWDFVRGGTPESFDIAHYTMQVAFAGDGTLHLTGRFGLASSDDAGDSWRSNFARRHVHGIAPNPHDSQMVLAGTSPGQDPTESSDFSGGRIVVTRNAGQTWTQIGTGFPHGVETSVHAFAFDPADPALAYAATTRNEFQLPATQTAIGVYKTGDGGSTWISASGGLADLNVNALATAAGRPGFVLAGTDVGLFRSDNAGSSWQAAGITGAVHAILVDPKENSHWWVGTHGGLHYSFDSGTTWARAEDVPVAFVPSLAMDAEGTVLYAAVNGHGVYAGKTG